MARGHHNGLIYTSLLLSLLAMTGPGLPASAQVSGVDYVITRTQLDAAGTKYLDAVQYYDGAGFPTQAVAKKITPSQTNLFTMQTYDNRGRDSRSYLPSEKSAGTVYLTGTDISSWTAAGYPLDGRPYTETLYEASPAGRTLSEQGPGDAWSGHAATTAYGANASSGTLSCKWYVVLSDGTLSDEGVRTAGTLRVTTATDEDGCVKLLFTDGGGRTLLSRTMNGTQALDTYSVYDGHGNLRYVLEPMYQETQDLSKYAFVYTYDVQDRVVSEQRPGCGTTAYWYDRGGHLVFSQDAVQAAAGTWTFFLWDNRHREVLRGVCPKTTADEYALTAGVVTVTYSSSDGLCGSGYATGQLSLQGASLLEATYYDDYTFLSRSGYTDRTVFPAASASVSANGLPTGRLSAVLGSNGSMVVRGATYYDAKGRAVKTVTTNLKGGSETETASYSYTDQPTARSIVHTASGMTTLTENYAYTYDHADRPLTVTHRVGSGSVKTILANTYDTQGRLLTESFEGKAATKRTYSYDIRSHVTGISAGSGGALFSESIGYTTGGLTARYGGAPSAVRWKVSGEGSWRGYLLSYDGAGRLSGASYGTASGSMGLINVNDAFTETVTGYDNNGNVTALQRYGKLASGGYGLIDNLSISLSGNRLYSVSDAVQAAAAAGNTAFTDGAASQADYSYDAAGRMTSDANKGITSITYNAIGLPSGATKSGATASWLYDGAGHKLRRTVNSGGIIETTDYAGNAVYDGFSLAMLQIPGGYVTLSGTTPTYHYYQKDHLGSNRLVTRATGSVEQIVHYYPFGGQFGDGTAPALQQYKFTGKELDNALDAHLYDFGARSYDPALMRWSTPDPLMGKYPSLSPYTYCANSPANIVDPNGMDWYINNENGYYTWFDGNEDKEGYTYFGGKGSLLGEAEELVDYLYGKYIEKGKSIFTVGFELEVRNSQAKALSGADVSYGLFGEFVLGEGPEFSVFTQNHPYTQELSKTKFIKKVLSNFEKIDNKYGFASKSWNLWDVLTTDSLAEQFIGSYTYQGKKSNDGKHFINVIYDSKNAKSLAYHLPGIEPYSRKIKKSMEIHISFIFGHLSDN